MHLSRNPSIHSIRPYTYKSAMGSQTCVSFAASCFQYCCLLAKVLNRFSNVKGSTIHPPTLERKRAHPTRRAMQAWDSAMPVGL
eukprot:2098109-Amphidinium_carterae.1